MVALLHGGDARADLDHDAGALMAEDRREQALRIGARQREVVGVADAGRLDLDQHLAGRRALQIDVRRSSSGLLASKATAARTSMAVLSRLALQLRGRNSIEIALQVSLERRCRRPRTRAVAEFTPLA